MTDSADDRALMKRIASADHLALRVLFSRYQVRVFRFIQGRVGNEAVAEELTNEVFIDVWRNAENYGGLSSPSTWILSIARYRAISALRKRTDENWDEEDAKHIQDEDDDPEVVSQKTDKSALLRKFLERLSPKHREVIDLVYYHELSIKEVSDIVGIPQGTVKSRLFNAHNQLSKLLVRAGIDGKWP